MSYIDDYVQEVILSFAYAPLPLPIKKVSQEGTVVRSGVNPNAAPSRIESCGSTMLLMAPPAPCGSFAVYGGWVGGPGRQGEVRLVRPRLLHIFTGFHFLPHKGGGDLRNVRLLPHSSPPWSFVVL